MTVNAIADTKKGRTGIAPTYLHTTPDIQMGQENGWLTGIKWPVVCPVVLYAPYEQTSVTADYSVPFIKQYT